MSTKPTLTVLKADHMNRVFRRLDSLNVSLVFLTKAGLFVGVSTVFFYCVSIHYFPRGLSFTEVLLFAFTALACALVQGVGLFGGAIAMAWVVELSVCALRRAKSKSIRAMRAAGARSFSRAKRGVRVLRSPKIRNDYSNLILTLISCISFVALVLSLGVPFARSWINGSSIGMEVLLVYFSAGFLVACGVAVRPPLLRPERLRQRKGRGLTTRSDFFPLGIMLIGLALAIPLLLITEPVVTMAMVIAGVREERASVVLDDQTHGYVAQAAGLQRIKLQDCRFEGGEHWLVSDVQILWQRFGSNALLEIRGTTAKEWARIEIPDQSMMHFGSASKPASCP
jgi:hypothetical protein